MKRRYTVMKHFSGKESYASQSAGMQTRTYNIAEV